MIGRRSAQGRERRIGAPASVLHLLGPGALCRAPKSLAATLSIPHTSLLPRGTHTIAQERARARTSEVGPRRPPELAGGVAGSVQHRCQGPVAGPAGWPGDPAARRAGAAAPGYMARRWRPGSALAAARRHVAACQPPPWLRAGKVISRALISGPGGLGHPPCPAHQPEMPLRCPTAAPAWGLGGGRAASPPRASRPGCPPGAARRPAPGQPCPEMGSRARAPPAGAIAGASHR